MSREAASEKKGMTASRADLLQARLARAFHQISRYYFQLEVHGSEHVPDSRDGSYMLAMNHTAVFGLEAYLLGTHLKSRDPRLDLRTLVWPGFLNGPFGAWFRAIGCAPASVDQGVELLAGGSSVLIMPEGIDATDVRNRFNPFHRGYLRILQRQPVPLIPVGFWGVDQAIPWWVSHNQWLAERIMKSIKPDFDFVPIPKPLAPRPVKVVLCIGEPIHLEYEDLNTEDGINACNERVRSRIEALVTEAELRRKESVNANRLNCLWHRLIDGKVSLLSPPKP